MKCVACNGARFDRKRVRFPVEIKGETVDVLSEAFVCEKCGESQMDTEQMNDFRRNSADTYRKKHGLLTSSEIIKFREDLKMSQTQFAQYLNVGEASIKRWETYYIQDESQNDHIRLKCDAAYAELNALQVYCKSHPPDIYNGHRMLNLELFKNAALYFVKCVKLSPLYLNKVMFYLDFLHFKNHGRSITGSRFIPIDYGPCPDQFQILFSYLEKNGVLSKKGKYEFASNCEPDLSLFDDQEIETLKAIGQILERKGEKYLYDLSHKERAFTETAYARPISYELAKHLKI